MSKENTKKSTTKSKEVVKKNSIDTEKKNTILKKDIREKKQKKAQRKKFVSGLLISLVVLIISGCLLYPMIKYTKFGLDLKGGFVHLTFLSPWLQGLLHKLYRLYNLFHQLHL